VLQIGWWVHFTLVTTVVSLRCKGAATCESSSRHASAVVKIN